MLSGGEQLTDIFYRVAHGGDSVHGNRKKPPTAMATQQLARYFKW